MAYIRRNLEGKLQKYLSSPEIIAVVGSRQCGKTTLLEHIYQQLQLKRKCSWVSFDDPEALSLFESKPAEFINLYAKGKDVLFIDEFQYASFGGKVLKQIYDLHHLKIFITGSSAIELTVKALKYLTGRIFTFELFPFSFDEYLSALDRKMEDYYRRNFSLGLPDRVLAIPPEIFSALSRHYCDYCLYGGYPRVVLSKDIEEKKEVLKGIYSTFVMREVRDYLGLVDEHKLHDLIKALALQTANLVAYNELSILSQYAHASLKKYLNFLGKAYLCALVRPFFTNRRKEIVKNPKAFFFDTGLRNAIVNDFRALDARPDSGALLENAVFMNLVRRGFSLSFWRDKNGREVDFVLRDADVKIAIEVKLNLRQCRPNASQAYFLAQHPDYRFLCAYCFGEGDQPPVSGQLHLPCFAL